jgi:quinolinate synthase
MLSENLSNANMGVVAHYYMDVELQGVLHAVGREQEKEFGSSRIAIADSLAMGDHAVRMCREGNVEAIACLGVDFMAESVSAIMERNGFGHIPVYRATIDPIGCSLAESAERDTYRAWLKTASQDVAALHVVYINTSLETKAISTSLVPTITCTSSNVLATMLQASAQMGPGKLKILYGPDTYMGTNLITMFDAILSAGETAEEPWDDARIARDLHPEHNRDSIQALRDSIDVYQNGICVVHHMFGGEVVNAVKRNYDNAFVTAHLEVPGEMFEIAMTKSLEGKGVVGSTSDILKFISKKVAEAAESGPGSASDPQRLQFILGTEAGMVTSIVKSVQDILDRTGNQNVEAEIVFPVASDAIMSVDDGGPDLAVVPGVGGGEGCSTAGGCATCPFMKMNDLDALNDVVEMVLSTQADPKSSIHEVSLRGHLPPDRLKGKMLGDARAIDMGIEPIMYMRQFMQDKRLPDELIQKVTAAASIKV